MRVTFRQSFVRDLKKIKDGVVLQRVEQAIAQLEAATHLQEISHVKKISGCHGYYRIRLGDYRVGLAVAEDTVEFVRCLHRRDLYRHFP